MTLSSIVSGYAQAPSGFEEFRQRLLNDFNSFKGRILDHYADFLAGEWHEYEPLEAEAKFTEPKPESIPTFEPLAAENGDEQIKSLRLSFGFNGDPVIDRDGSIKEPSIMSVLREGKGLLSMSFASLLKPSSALPSDSAEVKDTAKAKTVAPDGGIMTADGVVEEYDGDVFCFYGMRFAMPRVEFAIMDSIKSTLDFSVQWERLMADKVAERLNPHILALQKKTGISDYLMYEMIMAYLDHKMTTADDASKMSLTHYLLANMGFGVRIAIDDLDVPYILLPFTEKVFGKPSLPLAKTYYVFSAPGRPEVRRVGLRSPYVPDNAEQGKEMNLRMNGLELPMRDYRYDISYEGITLRGSLNENVMPMLYRYPQMDTGGFAACMISPEVRSDVVAQLKSQLGDMEPMEAADRLLAMIQFGFPYATDDKFHGFEKPYFFEEMLYYPKSDCEDRAAFFSYLLWNALGLENDLITYPNHEATAIRAEQVWGGDDHYLRKESKYFISDPTFQGAPTGKCMPRYVDMQPGIDLSFE